MRWKRGTKSRGLEAQNGKVRTLASVTEIDKERERWVGEKTKENE